MADMPNFKAMREAMSEFVQGTQFDEALPEELPADPDPQPADEGTGKAELPARKVESTLIQL